jgi:hypothetical protein
VEPEVTHDEVRFDAQTEDAVSSKENRFEQNVAYWKKLSTIIAVAGPTIF